MKKYLGVVAAGVVLLFSLLKLTGDSSSLPFWQSLIESGMVLGTQDEQGFEVAVVERVIDGDTIELSDGRTVRYIGIDTPETKHPTKNKECFGVQASDFNEQLVAGRTVRLEKDVSETDRYGRLLRYVWLDEDMVNLRLVQEGYASAASFPPDVKYQQLFFEAEADARSESFGLWRTCQTGDPVEALNQTIDEAEQNISQPDTQFNCTIKGNISDNGLLYHLPDCPSYNQTKIDVSQGERWFCSEDEAVAAGWTKARGC